jgi:hypothetical protein
LAISKARKKKEAPGETLPARREDKMEVLVEEPDKEPDKCIYCYEQLCGWVTTKEGVILFLDASEHVHLPEENLPPNKICSRARSRRGLGVNS